MSRTQLLLRLVGTLPATDELTRRLGVRPSNDIRRGTVVRALGRAQDVDVWWVVLIERQQWTGVYPDEPALTRAVAMLERMAPELSTLVEAGNRGELYISSIRDEDQGGFYLAPGLVSVAAKAHLSVNISILVMLDDDEEETESKVTMT